MHTHKQKQKQKKQQETGFIFHMVLSVSIIWYTDVFSIYLNGLQCSDNMWWNFYPKLLLCPLIQAGNSYPSWPFISRSSAAVFPATLSPLSSWTSVQLIFFRPCIGLSVVLGLSSALYLIPGKWFSKTSYVQSTNWGSLRIQLEEKKLREGHFTQKKKKCSLVYLNINKFMLTWTCNSEKSWDVSCT